MINTTAYSCEHCAAAGNAWCPLAGMCAVAPLPSSIMMAGDAGVCPQSAWVDGQGSSTCPAVSPGVDPLYEMNRWVFQQINVESVWAQGINGTGVQINVVDGGTFHTHDDLVDKFDATASCKGSAMTSSLDHGTTTAAIAVAAANDKCSRGIAFEATFSKCPFTGTTSAEQLTFDLVRNMISSNSWGIDPCSSLSGRRRQLQSSSACPFASTSASSSRPSPCTSSSCPTDWTTATTSACDTVISSFCQSSANYEANTECASWTHLWMACQFTHLSNSELILLQQGVMTGRSGKGVVYVFASGNENTAGEDVNHEQYLHSRWTITVGAVDKLGQHSYYSTVGSSLFVSAPGGDTAAHTNNWFVASPDGGCKERGQGTSYATPVVSGVVALILQANPALTYRDVQGVIASTTQKNDPTEGGWITNAAGFKHNIKYGFGLIDAAAAVAAAETWTLWGAEQRIEAMSPVGSTIVPHDGTALAVSLTVPSTGAFSATEWVEMYINLDHSSRGHLQLLLTSPSGTQSVLIPGPRPETTNPTVEGCSAATDTCPHANDGTCDNPQYCAGDMSCDYNDCLATNWVGASNSGNSIYNPLFNWKMTTLRAWGESPVGTWTLTITDMKLGDTPTNSNLISWNLFIYGH